LKELSKRLVDTEERGRRAISRELHDEVGQSLSALLLDVENLTQMSIDDSAFRQGLQKIKALAENCIKVLALAKPLYCRSGFLDARAFFMRSPCRFPSRESPTR
jgi:glucose-6-phosphate-specific signal transduction histidine kinase